MVTLLVARLAFGVVLLALVGTLVWTGYQAETGSRTGLNGPHGQ